MKMKRIAYLQITSGKATWNFILFSNTEIEILNYSLSLQNSYMNEKIDAIIALGELASGAGLVFTLIFSRMFGNKLNLLLVLHSCHISTSPSKNVLTF